MFMEKNPCIFFIFHFKQLSFFTYECLAPSLYDHTEKLKWLEMKRKKTTSPFFLLQYDITNLKYVFGI